MQKGSRRSCVLSSTHRIFNQVPDLSGYNLYTCDSVLQDAVAQYGASWREGSLSALGVRLGEAETLSQSSLANRFPPELQTHDRLGERIDCVRYHPSWHALLRILRGNLLHALPFAEPRPGAWAARTAGYFLQGQAEAGSLCPATMTFASIPVMQQEPKLFSELGPRLLSASHDTHDLPWRRKSAVLIGMGMTEKQGGSDVRSNSTVARPAGSARGRGEEYLLTGHKWFYSAPMCDAHLVVARLEHESGPLACFFVPRFRDDGSKNPVLLQRLKDKLGNRSNASAEVEFADATGILIGEEGRGLQTILEMATYTRLDCVIGSSAILRQAVVQALHHAGRRMAFGKRLVEQPLMRNVLLDLSLESEAATRLMMHLADAFERAAHDPAAEAWKRIVTPAAKFWVCKRTVDATAEAMEVWGGNGYVEDGPLARLYREAPVNSIWEGSGNIMCLDVLRAIHKSPESATLLFQSIEQLAGGDSRIRGRLEDLQTLLEQPAEMLEAEARRVAQLLVLTAQGALMLRYSTQQAADLFLRSRFKALHGRVFGTMADVSPKLAQRLIEESFPL
jgi:putative acyl-CoA dehydrogenase